MSVAQAGWPRSLRQINALSEPDKLAIYRTLLPDWLFTRFGITQEDLRACDLDRPMIQFRSPPRSRAVEITVKRKIADVDPLLYFEMADTFNNQLLVLLLVVNDPEAPRFNTDVDEQGNLTHFGTVSRNLPAECAAMQAGLSPGQVRTGLRSFRDTLPLFERFVKNMGHDMFLIEPLAYTNAILFERYGFHYLRGYKEMQQIHERFQPGGDLHEKLDGENPFRAKDAWKTVRGRAWAIHDGILGHPYTGFQMYKYVGKSANISTFPDLMW